MSVAEGLVFPDVRMCLVELIDGNVHLDVPVEATWRIQAKADGFGAIEMPENGALVWIGPPRGTEGFLDRVDRVTLECYYPGNKVVNILESIKASLTGANIDTPSGFLDSIAVVNAPEAVPYQSDTLNKAAATFDIVTRPLN